ncbi:MAG: UDP-N-acetyl-D-mannosaminuronic acid dehydrogenase [Chloroflexota bacterium]|nr:UDP-N-acetyl-D-mannosaminuronic acid dehydrogenase [Chloroflexota bacterium]
MTFETDVVIVGGCGHVGLPLGIALAHRGLRVVLYDVNDAVVPAVNAGCMPFLEAGAPEMLRRALANGLLRATTDPSVISGAEHVVTVIGTPVDRHLNPHPQSVPLAIEDFGHHLVGGQLLVLRSTVYPGVTRMVEKLVAQLGVDVDVAFCPERIAEGRAMTELTQLPQIVSARTPRALRRSAALFGNLTDRIIELEPEEAELAKLFTNVWRYIKFAAANQLYMIANDYSVDFDRVRDAIVTEYPRAADMPTAGFSAGPCLFKDTMSLAAFTNNNFTLGHASVMINEGMPLYIISRLEKQHDLGEMTVGILGMAFKGESDDVRSSLSYKVKRILSYKARRVLCADPYVRGDDDLVDQDTVVAESDLILIGAPHRRYAELRPAAPVVDISNLLGQGVLV